jgi:hypothetical protein
MRLLRSACPEILKAVQRRRGANVGATEARAKSRPSTSRRISQGLRTGSIYPVKASNPLQYLSIFCHHATK